MEILLNFLNSLIQIPVPILPPKHVEGCKWLEWIVYAMDNYRDLRLIWTVLEAALVIFILALVLIMAYKIHHTKKCMHARYNVLNERISKITEIHERLDELEEDKEDVNAHL